VPPIPHRRRGHGGVVVRPLDDAAAATAAAVQSESDRMGVYNIVDDEPAPVAEWLPALAAAIGPSLPGACPRGWLACSWENTGWS
jgi:nucleoside-diphosphate-sugar epimerase